MTNLKDNAKTKYHLILFSVWYIHNYPQITELCKTLMNTGEICQQWETVQQIVEL